MLVLPAARLCASAVESLSAETVATCVDELVHENITPGSGEPPEFNANALRNKLSPATKVSSVGATTTLAISDTTVTLTFDVLSHVETLTVVVPTPRARTSPELVTTTTEVSPDPYLNETSVRGAPRRFNAVSAIWTESLCRGGARNCRTVFTGETIMLETGSDTSQTPAKPVAVSPLHAMAALRPARPSTRSDRLIT